MIRIWSDIRKHWQGANTPHRKFTAMKNNYKT